MQHAVSHIAMHPHCTKYTAISQPFSIACTIKLNDCTPAPSPGKVIGKVIDKELGTEEYSVHIGCFTVETRRWHIITITALLVHCWTHHTQGSMAASQELVNDKATSARPGFISFKKGQSRVKDGNKFCARAEVAALQVGQLLVRVRLQLLMIIILLAMLVAIYSITSITSAHLGKT